MGHVIFVGAGPGAADLITLRGARALAWAEVVLHDALTDPALRSHGPQARWIDVGKRGFAKAMAQERINALLVEAATTHDRVVRLKGGDPSLFARLEEELRAVAAAGLSCEVVPGITAALAAAAATARPLTRRARGRSVAFATAMTATGAVPAAQRADTEVYYMAGRQLATLGPKLADAGWPADTPVSVVSRAGWSDQAASWHTLATLHEAGTTHLDRPAVAVVGVGATDCLGPDEPTALEPHQPRVQTPSL